MGRCKPRIGRTGSRRVITLRAVLQLLIVIFFLVLQSIFVSALAMEIVGPDVTPDARSIAMIWLTLAEVPAVADVDTDPVVSLQRLDLTAPTCHQESVPLTTQASGTFNRVE